MDNIALVLINQLGLKWSTGKHISLDDGSSIPTAGIPGLAVDEYQILWTAYVVFDGT